MKFGVSTGQTRAKIIQTSKQCLSCARYCAPDAHTAVVAAGELVHASAIAPDFGVGALIIAHAPEASSPVYSVPLPRAATLQNPDPPCSPPPPPHPVPD